MLPCQSLLPSGPLPLLSTGCHGPPDGEPFHLSGEFLEIDPPWRLVSTFAWEEPTADDRETVVDLSLGRTGNATRLVLSQVPFLTDERLELHSGGWTESFETRIRGAGILVPRYTRHG
ncbi:SRPBCC family protein [Pseudarthrobacter albicanus]|uniref:SRPBCC family protein n=1 Tax=Pseudarthrobacter albicanus TaxID=2823873 RepID=UPI001BA6A9E4|nr:SRPBCC domain-containing protein [Pseudarthrobacter albicanus]